MQDSQNHIRAWINSDNALEFQFFADERWGDPEVGYIISRRGYPIQGNNLEGVLTLRESRLEYVFSDGYRLKGQMRIILYIVPGGKEKLGIWGNLFMGFARMQQHFEGLLFSFSEGAPLPVPPAPILQEPVVASPVAPPGQPVMISGEGDLFPYIYMRIWPAMKPDTLAFFVHYVPPEPPPPVPSLYEKLKALKAAKSPSARYEMEKGCVEYVEHAAGRGISEWYYRLPHLYNKLLKEDEWEPDLLVIAIREFLKLEEPVLEAFVHSAAFQTGRDREWQLYFALVVLQGYDLELYTNVCKTLLMFHFIQQLTLSAVTGKLLRELLHAMIILPKDVFPLPRYDALVLQPVKPAAGSIEPYAIGYLQMVRQRLLRYEAGEIARIDNILRGERKEITRRHLRQQQEGSEWTGTTVDSTENISSEVSNDLRSAAQRTLADFTWNTEYSKFDITYGPPTTATLNGSVAQTLTGAGPSKENISGFAKQVLDGTIGRIVEETSRRRIHSVLQETEESSSSIFDNSGGSCSYRGVYRWLNKVYEIRVVSYGVRMMIELIVRDPAAAYIAASKRLEGRMEEEPGDPLHRLKTFAGIGRENYAELCGKYRVEKIIPPPAAAQYTGLTLQAGESNKLLVVPEGYCAGQVYVQTVLRDGTKELHGMVGTQPFHFPGDDPTKPLKMMRETGTVPVSVTSTPDPAAPPSAPGGFLVNIELECVLTEHAFAEWQIKIFQAIMDAYKREKATYYDNRVSGQQEEGNPAIYDRIERACLKNAGERLLMDIYYKKVGFTDSNGPMAEEVVSEPRYRQFLGHLFEWNEMSYTLYDKEEAFVGMPEIFEGRFRAFLQASYARVLLPVRPGLELAALYYFSSGLAWTGPAMFLPVHLPDATVAAEWRRVEMRREDRPLPESWEITVPTTMQIVQDEDPLLK